MNKSQLNHRARGTPRSDVMKRRREFSAGSCGTHSRTLDDGRDECRGNVELSSPRPSLEVLWRLPPSSDRTPRLSHHHLEPGRATQVSPFKKPSRLLWLTHEQLPHPEAVICPADENQVKLVIDLLSSSYERRMGLLQRLKAIAVKLKTIPPIERPGIPARMPNGLYEPVSWRFVLWLSHAMGIQAESRRTDLIRQLETWLERGDDCKTISTDY